MKALLLAMVTVLGPPDPLNMHEALDCLIYASEYGWAFRHDPGVTLEEGEKLAFAQCEAHTRLKNWVQKYGIKAEEERRPR